MRLDAAQQRVEVFVAVWSRRLDELDRGLGKACFQMANQMDFDRPRRCGFGDGRHDAGTFMTGKHPEQNDAQRWVGVLGKIDRPVSGVDRFVRNDNAVLADTVTSQSRFDIGAGADDAFRLGELPGFFAPPGDNIFRTV